MSMVNETDEGTILAAQPTGMLCACCGYDGCCLTVQAADVWSCGVMLYVMLSAQYPFGRPEDTHLKTARQMHVMLQVSCHTVQSLRPAPVHSSCC